MKKTIKKNTVPRSPVSTAFIRYQSFLKRFLGRYLHSPEDIDEVAQETFLKAFQAEKNKDIEKPKAFLFRIAKNIALTRLTKKSQQITDYIADLDDSVVIDISDSLEDEVTAREYIGLYCEAVAALPEKCRRIYLMRKVHGMTHAEIAEYTGLTVSSVEKHLRNGLLKCQAYLLEREQPKSGLIKDFSSSQARQQG